MKTTTGYMLFVENKPHGFGQILEEAKSLAANSMSCKQQLRIESYVAPAPSQVWLYDYDIKAWVEQR
jgi:hypothetical protein